MSDDLTTIIDHAEESMNKAIGHLEVELIKVRAGKANPNLVDGLVVDYYGTPTPINQVGNISVARCADADHSTMGKKYVTAYRKIYYCG